MKEKHMKQKYDDGDPDDEMGQGAGLNGAGKKNANLKSADEDPFALPTSASKPNLNKGSIKPKEDTKKPVDLKASDLGKLDPKHNHPNDSLAGLKNPVSKEQPREYNIGASGVSNTSQNPKTKRPEPKDELEDLLYNDAKPDQPRTTGNTNMNNSKPKLPAVKDNIGDLMYSDAKPEPPRVPTNTNLNNSKPNLLPRKSPADAPVTKPLENNSSTKQAAITKPATVTKPPAFDEPLLPDDEDAEDFEF